MVTQTVVDVPDGLYHYDVRSHELVERRAGNLQRAMAAIALGQEMVLGANAIVVITALLDRTMQKYKQRGYRYALMEAGHLAQNICLVAAGLGLGSVPIGGFFDRELGELLALDQSEELAIYAVCTGHGEFASPSL